MHACKEGNEKTSKDIKPQLDAPCGGKVQMILADTLYS